MKAKVLLVFLLLAGMVWGQQKDTIDAAKVRIIEKGEKIDSLNQRLKVLNTELKNLN